MKSIRKFVEHLGREMSIVNHYHMSDIGRMDSELLEKGYVCHTNFAQFPFWDESGIPPMVILAWVVIWQDKPYLISSFDVTHMEPDDRLKTTLWIRLREIKEGLKLPSNLLNVHLEECVDVSVAVKKGIRIANCSMRTYKWLKSHKATKKVIERISQVA